VRVGAERPRDALGEFLQGDVGRTRHDGESVERGGTGVQSRRS
jgi:hypothetical protein